MENNLRKNIAGVTENEILASIWDEEKNETILQKTEKVDNIVLEILQEAGYKELKDNNLYEYVTPIHTFKFWHLQEIGEDDQGIPCANVYGVMEISSNKSK